MDHQTMLDTVAEEQETWTVTEAVLVGLGFSIGIPALLLISNNLFVSSGLSVNFSQFQTRELTMLCSLVGMGMLVGLAAVLIFRKRGLGGWRRSIEWNFGGYVWRAMISGAALSLFWSISLAVLGRGVGSFRDSPLMLSLLLYALAEVIVSPALEEMYFRGILFSALARRLGPLLAVAIVTVAFDLVHIGRWFAVLPASIALGITRLKTKSVAACFAFHASYNSFLMFYMLLKH
jgi:membrane protease YdiL (CAAX protease family)